jgi:hypothetical protein
MVEKMLARLAYWGSRSLHYNDAFILRDEIAPCCSTTKHGLGRNVKSMVLPRRSRS